MKVIENPKIEFVKGFYSNGIHCGLKSEEKLDLGVIYIKKPALTFGMYTTNKFKAPPLLVCKKHLKNHKAQLLVVNSKIANACTGEEGLKNAFKVCEIASKLFNVNADDVLPLSTGVIGEQLPVEKIKNGLERIKNIIFENNENNFSKAILTTDSYPKIYGVKGYLNGIEYTIVGTCKGAGMISPNMATMLAFICTDVNIKPNLLKKAFKNAVNKSFNSITVDGDMSTNDTALILSSQMAGNKKITNQKSKEYKEFCNSLESVCIELAKSIVRDGEGATKLIEINVKNAKTINDAKNICMNIANSKLVKTAFFGEDPNWGRIICTLGYTKAHYNPNKVVLFLENLALFKNGMKESFDEKEAKKILQKKEFSITLDLNAGNKQWKVWTCDLTYDYIKINASYRT